MGTWTVIDPETIRQSAERGDLHYPHAEWKPIADNWDQPKIRARLFIVHTMAGSRSTTWEQLWSYTDRQNADGTGEATETEPTWGLSFDGSAGQFMSAEIKAHTNSRANDFALSVETQDDGYLADPGIRDSAWTGEQLEQMAGMFAWMHLNTTRFDVPLQICDRWDGAGLGYHRMFAEWSGRGLAHTCPGATRIGQFPQILELARQVVADSKPKPPPEEDAEMLEVLQDLLEVARSSLTQLRYIRGGSRPGGGTYGTSGVQQIRQDTKQIRSSVAAVEANTDALIAEMEQLNVRLDELADHLNAPEG